MTVSLLMTSIACAAFVPHNSIVSIDEFGAVHADVHDDTASTTPSFFEMESSDHHYSEQGCEMGKICDVTGKKGCAMSCDKLIQGCRSSFIEESSDTPPRNKRTAGVVLDAESTASKMADSLKRDPEEEQKYNAQMLSAIGDKMRMFEPMFSESLERHPIVVVDIGPAGGAIPKALAQVAMNQYNTKTSTCGQVRGKHHTYYYGVELNKEQVREVDAFLKDPARTDNKVSNDKATCTPDGALGRAAVVEANALDLQRYMGKVMVDLEGNITLQQTSGMFSFDNTKLLIIESSVLHEIYSYAPCDSQVCGPRLQGMLTPEIRAGFAVAPLIMNGTQRYRQEVVLKNYEEALLSLNDMKSGGMLSIRDGVLYKKPNELVEFKLLTVEWKTMFKKFVGDQKYSAGVDSFLKSTGLPKHQFQTKAAKGETITLPAKFVQEFMLKANWGLEGWNNEIHEVYAYATLSTHKRIAQTMAKLHKINIHFEKAEEYVQCDYPMYVRGNIEIISGFGCTQGQANCCAFPPTNMLLKIVVK